MDERPSMDPFTSRVKDAVAGRHIPAEEAARRLAPIIARASPRPLSDDEARRAAAAELSEYGGGDGISAADWVRLCGVYPALIRYPLQWSRTHGYLIDQQAIECPAPVIAQPPPAEPSAAIEHGSRWLAWYDGVSTTAVSVAQQLVSWAENLFAGAFAGAVAKTIIAPGDRVKILFQVDPSRRFSLGAAVRMAQKIVEASGVSGLWTGHTATLMRVMPAAACTYVSFDKYFAFFKRRLAGGEAAEEPSHSRLVVARFLAGASAGATSTVLTYPLDLMRARYAAHWDTSKRYPSYTVAFQSVVREEGWRALYSGLKPTLCGIVPYAGASFMFFETFKHLAQQQQGLDSAGALPWYQRLLFGSLAGLIAQSATYPLDILRRRMQVNPWRYRTMRGTLRDIVKHEGVVRGLYKGLSMNWIKGPIAVGVSYTANDYLRHRIKTYHAAVAAGGDAIAVDRLSFVERALCGCVAGGIAKLWTAPFDRLKIMFAVGVRTVDGSRQNHVVKTVREMVGDSPHMWRGSSVMMARVVPYAGVTYATFGLYQDAAQRVVFSREHTMLSNFIAGALAAATATAAFHPMDLMRARNAANAGRRELYSSTYLGIYSMARNGSLYHGLRQNVIGIGPMAGVGFALYHEGTDYFGAETFPARLAVGAAAGCTAQLVTYPFNVVRRRAMLNDAYDSTLHGMHQIYRNEGLYLGLYSRMPMGWVMGAMTVGLSFAINDAMQGVVCSVRNRAHAELPFA
jgi:solute carrier family 25 protein 42